MSFGHGAIILGAGEGKTIPVLGNAYTYKAAKEDTGGAYALIEHSVVADGPPPHIHTAEEEAFYVLEGELNVLVGDRTVTATSGAFVLVPRGTVHTYSKAGTASAKILVIISPAGFEKFFEEIAGPPDLEKIKALAPKYNLEIVGPAPEKDPGNRKKRRCHQIKRDFGPPIGRSTEVTVPLNTARESRFALLSLRLRYIMRHFLPAICFCVLAMTVGCKDGPAHRIVELSPVLPAGADKFAFGDKVRVHDIPATKTAGVAGRVGNIAGFTKPSQSGEKVIGDVKDDLAFSVIFENPKAQLWFAPELLEFVSHTDVDIKIGRQR